MITTFNRSPLQVSPGLISEPSIDLVRSTPSLLQATVAQAALYGGELTRRALDVIPLEGDRDFTIVDTKVHLLMKGQCPAIPGWHTDGVPRGRELDPFGRGAPDIAAQSGARMLPAPRYHLLVTGGDLCPTRFATDPDIGLAVPDRPDPALYEMVSKQMAGYAGSTCDTETTSVYTWDWWQLHTATLATRSGWRFLMRVTETDFLPPRRELNDVIRTQVQVYTPLEFGW